MKTLAKNIELVCIAVRVVATIATAIVGFGFAYGAANSADINPLPGALVVATIGAIAAAVGTRGIK